MARVYVSKVNNDLARRIEEGLDFIRCENIIKPDSTVVVKPNFVWPEHMPGVTTSPEFLATLLPILKQRCRRLIVGESNGPKPSMTVEAAFKNHGLYELAEKHGFELVNFCKMPSSPVDTVIAGKRVKTTVPALALEADVFITLPVLKTHVFTDLSISLKNQWGCIPDSMRVLQHWMLDRGIVAINKTIKPKISIVEGTYALDGNGPVWGKPVRFDTLIVSDDLVAADSVGAHLLGFNPQTVKHIRYAEQEGLGTTDIKKMELNAPLPQGLKFKVAWTLVDRLAYVTCSRQWITKLVYDSALTNLIYFGLRRQKPQRIV